MSLTPVLISLLIWLPVGHHAKMDRVVAANPPPTHARIGRWRLTVRRDTFAGRATCRLSRGPLSYERRTLVLTLSPKLDTSLAVYRVDWGAPTPVAADRGAIASLGFSIWQDNLSNPSGGLVRVPYARLAAAHAIEVEPRPGAPVWRFSLDGLSGAVAAANRAGCA